MREQSAIRCACSFAGTPRRRRSVPGHFSPGPHRDSPHTHIDRGWMAVHASREIRWWIALPPPAIRDLLSAGRPTYLQPKLHSDKKGSGFASAASQSPGRMRARNTLRQPGMAAWLRGCTSSIQHPGGQRATTQRQRRYERNRRRRTHGSKRRTSEDARGWHWCAPRPGTWGTCVRSASRTAIAGQISSHLRNPHVAVGRRAAVVLAGGARLCSGMRSRHWWEEWGRTREEQATATGAGEPTVESGARMGGFFTPEPGHASRRPARRRVAGERGRRRLSVR